VGWRECGPHRTSRGTVGKKYDTYDARVICLKGICSCIFADSLRAAFTERRPISLEKAQPEVCSSPGPIVRLDDYTSICRAPQQPTPKNGHLTLGRSMNKVHFVLFVGLLLAAMSCLAGQAPAPRIVDLTATDGIKLKASYFSAGKPGPGVLLLHQCDHDRKIWDGLAQRLATAGINVLTMDLRGFGDSGDTPHSKTGPIEPAEEMQKWPSDIDVAYHYLKSQSDVKSDLIGVGGASCGLSNAIKTAIRHPEVKSLVLLSGPSDVKDRMFLRQTKIPTFFAVSDDDPYPLMVPFTEWLYLASASPGKKFAHYKTGGHGAEMFAVHSDLLTAIVDWYTVTLIKTPGQAPLSNDAPVILAEARTWDLLERPGGPARLAQALSAARQKDPKASLVTPQIVAESKEKNPKTLETRMQQMIDEIADQHFEAGDVKQSLEIAKLDALAYPNSPAAYFLLSQAYASQGQKNLARRDAQKTLKLLPSDKLYGPNIHEEIKKAVQDILKQSDVVQ
jgi:dienelactone hydrolase